MKRVVAALAFWLLVAGSALGQAPGGQPLMRYSLGQISGRNADTYGGQFEDMDRQLNLTADQKKKVKADVDAMNAALNAAQEEVFGAPMAGGGGLQIKGDLLDLQDKLNAIANEHELKIMGDLDDVQRVAWAQHILEPLITAHFGELKLTPEQVDKSTALVAAAAKDLAAATDAKKYAEIQGHLIRRWIGDVLTDAQATGILRRTLGPELTVFQVVAPADGGAGRGDPSMP